MSEDRIEWEVRLAGIEGMNLDPIRREAYDWVARCLGKGLTPDEVDAMKRWYGRSPNHAAAYAEARRVWKMLGPIADEAMQKTQAGRNASAARSIRPILNRRAFLGGAMTAAAASATFLVVRPPMSLWPSYADLMADYRTKVGEQRKVSLENSISLNLNSRTSVAVRRASSGIREIELLTGEVAIVMQTGSPTLTVVTGGVRTVATGADFNLRCDDGRGAISCLKGEVRVEGVGPMVPLASRQEVTFGDHGMGSVAAIDPDRVTAWQRGLLIFDAVPIAQIVDEINRYRSGRIVLMNRELGQRLMTARLRISETDAIVLQIEHIFGAKATKLPGGVTVLT